MGLELAEIRFAVEKKFGIEFETAEFRFIATVGDFLSLILAKLGAGNRHVCRTLATFLKLREVFATHCGIPTRTVKRDTLFHFIIPYHGRRKRWRKIGADVGGLPPLARPRWLRIVLVTGAIALVLLTGTITVAFVVTVVTADGAVGDAASAAMTFFFLFCGLPTLTLFLCTQLFANRFPRSCQRVGDILPTGEPVVPIALTVAPEEIELAVWRELTEIIATVLGLSPESIDKHQRFIEDLKAD
jgi:acyl carrier protein